MATRTAEPRNALLAGSTGLVGAALLPLLRASPHYGALHLLLRRTPPGVTADARTTLHLVDFDRLGALPAVDDVYIALGTTIKAAGSQQAFRRVDFDAVVNTARAARAAGATRLAIVSALGADAKSAVFYNRVKGEMQDAVAVLGYESVVLAQPSLLLGDRAALGQPTRPVETFAARTLGPLLGLVPRAVRPIRADVVAGAMIAAMLNPVPGLRLLPSKDMQP